ncbi:hypothetical protein DV517_61780 [Streptomyces sp. S816]|uniref:hypothetical protein n=1 Tax=Streptomyces sp. S816 TaxID=2283197 RepID=UPI00109D2580|nr:hypothetical protein [Streptomyces sp. S816]TGZ14695.1 hypothetical protein DV517_61780 [Streptomyces sp. S816]
MVWFALDDGFDTHPKVRKAGNAAVGLFVRLGVHATKHLTEGHLDGDIVRDYGTAATIRKLIAVGMLHEPGHGCRRCPQPADGGYYLHDYLDYNKSRAQIEAAREAARKRQQKGRDTARANRNGRDSGVNLNSNSRQNERSSRPNCAENAPLFDDEPAGQDGSSRRDTHEGATVVPSPPIPSQNYDVADVDGGTTGSSPVDLDAYAPSPIDIDGWTLTDGLRRWAHRDGYATLVDLDYETAQFLDHFRGNGSRRPNWNTEWQKWIRRAHKWATERSRTSNVIALPGQPGAPLTGTDAKVAGWMAIAEQLRQQGDSA